MVERTPQHVTLRFGQLRDALGVMIGIGLPAENETVELGKARTALSERLGNLRRMHFPPGVNVTKAAKVDYGATAIASLATAAHLENMHLNPRVVIRALTGSQTEVWRFVAAALSCAVAGDRGYRPAGSLLLLFGPSGLDDLGTKAARAGRYDAPPSPAQLVASGDEDQAVPIHGIALDDGVVGASLAAGLRAVSLDPAMVVDDLRLRVDGRRLQAPGNLVGYRADAAALLRLVGRHEVGVKWNGGEVADALILLDAMQAGGDEDAFADLPFRSDHPRVTFRTALQAVLERSFAPVRQIRGQPLTISLLEVNDALGVSHDAELQRWLLDRLREGG